MISVRVRPSLEREEKAWFIGKDASSSVLSIGAVIIGMAFTTFFCILSYVNDVGNIINVIFAVLVLVKAITDFIRNRQYGALRVQLYSVQEGCPHRRLVHSEI